MENTIVRMSSAIARILESNQPSIYLYGSCTTQDFRPGWSDIDLLVLTAHPITIPHSEELLTLRQTLPILYPDATFARSCEGGMLTLDAFTKGYPDRVVYWGTSGQRITDHHHFDPFSLWLLHESGQLLHGAEVRQFLPKPTAFDLHAAVARHLRTILDHGRGGDSLYAFGWLLDIARGLYTLQHDGVIAKTAAGEWALRQGLCPDAEALLLALRVRQDPSLIHQEEIRRQACALTPAICSFAAVLHQALERRGVPIPE